MMEALDLTNQNYKMWNNMPWLGLIATLNKGYSLLHFLEQEAHYLILLSTHHELLLILFLFLSHPKKIEKKNKKGNIVCDTVYLDAKDPSLK